MHLFLHCLNHLGNVDPMYTYAVLEIRSKCRMDKCPSIILLGQTISDLLGHIFGEVHMCHSRCATVDVHQQIMKA